MAAARLTLDLLILKLLNMWTESMHDALYPTFSRLDMATLVTKVSAGSVMVLSVAQLVLHELSLLDGIVDYVVHGAYALLFAVLLATVYALWADMTHRAGVVTPGQREKRRVLHPICSKGV
jgi:hypothetical protein